MASQRNGGISWTDETWNPIRGCSRVSEGCRNCYAERQGARFSGPGGAYEGIVKLVPKYLPNHRPSIKCGSEPHWTGEVRFIEEHLADPLKWRNPRMVFVNSMSDLFHEKVPDEWIDRIFAVMAMCQHTFQILTKRPERMREYLSTPNRKSAIADAKSEILDVGVEQNRWPLPNVWLGVSVEDQKTADERIPLLLQTPAAVRWVSYEPVLGPVNFTRLYGRVCIGNSVDLCVDALSGKFTAAWKGRDSVPDQLLSHLTAGKLDWIVCGGESGPNARSFNIQWARNTIAQCKAAGVPCFVKQLGAKPQEISYPYDVTEKEARNWMGDGWTRIIDESGSHWRKYYRFEDRKGGNWDEWPEDLRVREYPNAVSV